MEQGIYMRLNAAAKEVVIEIVGVIGWDVWADRFRAMLGEIGEDVETVRFSVYSYGGDVWEGNDMIARIGALKQRTVADVQIAASMATLIAVACDEVHMASNGRWLVHSPWTGVAGDAATLEKRAKELRDTETEAVAFYARKTGKTSEEIRTLMGEERWLTPDEAKAFGFVDTIDDPFDLAKYKDATKAMLAANLIPTAMAAFAQAALVEEPTDDAAGTNDTEGAGEPGAAGEGDGAGDGTAPELSPEAVAHLAKIEQRLRAQSDAAYQEGVDAGKQEAAAGQAAAIEAACTPLREQVSVLTAELAKARNEIGQAAEAYKLSEAKVAEYDRRLAALAGGLAHRDEGADDDGNQAPKTWKEATGLLGYAKARKQYPGLWEAYMNETDKRNRK